MTNILNDYSIKPSTMALLPTRHFEYDTLVMEQEQEFYVRKTPLQLIKKACLEARSSYDGRREYIMYKTNFRHKVPIPVNPSLQIYAFPTRSPQDFNCKWIFFQHIQSLQHAPSIKSSNEKSIITFKNGQTLGMGESYYLLERQMQRTGSCVLIMREGMNQPVATS
ncbi:competence protein ComK [Salinibacillus kushneri]|uniref:Competence protein ComK n=1 Tax=Salinibacillus kushneri TaxID=237682 RepID=A0A1I0CDB6_9BACI|nr:competence protein ComK [Salinibacillus kushneri]SET17086.1 competence protein ComK [Salinibacillus kushneri]